MPTPGGPRGRSLTIGEAVARLAAEFPGIRAETLRVLEQHGLVSPARNSSGFRRYGDRDLEAVRRALTGPPAPRAEPPEPAAPPAPARAAPAPASGSTASARAGGAASAAEAPDARRRAAAAPRSAFPEGTAASSAAAPRSALLEGTEATSAAAARSAFPEAEPTAAASEEALSAASQGAAKRRAARWPEPDYFTPELGEVALGRDGLARAAGLAGEWVDELAAHGLISGREPASGTDLLVARAAAELLGHGIEPRHLRPVQAAADRAAVLIRTSGGGSSKPNTARTAAALVRLEAALLRAALLDD